MTVVQLLVSLQVCLIVMPYLVNVPKLNQAASRLYTGSVLIHQAVACGVAAGLLWAMALILGLFRAPSELRSVIWALTWTGAFLLFREHARQVCFARLWPAVALLLDTSIAVVQIAGLVILTASSRLSASSTCWRSAPLAAYRFSVGSPGCGCPVRFSCDRATWRATCAPTGHSGNGCFSADCFGAWSASFPMDPCQLPRHGGGRHLGRLPRGGVADESAVVGRAEQPGTCIATLPPEGELDYGDPCSRTYAPHS